MVLVGIQPLSPRSAARRALKSGTAGCLRYRRIIKIPRHTTPQLPGASHARARAKAETLPSKAFRTTDDSKRDVTVSHLQQTITALETELRPHKASEGQLKHALEKLQLREKNLRAIEHTPECVKVVAQDGTLLEINPAGLLLLEAESAVQVVSKSIYNVIAPEFREAFRHLNQQVCAGAKAQLEFEIIGLKGVRRWMHTHAAPTTNPLKRSRRKYAQGDIQKSFNQNHPSPEAIA